MGVNFQRPQRAQDREGNQQGAKDFCRTAGQGAKAVGRRSELVTHSLKAIWDNIDKLPPLNPQFQEWTRERAASAEVTIPYHPAAVQFYKEKSLWNAKMDETQKRLLAINP